MISRRLLLLVFLLSAFHLCAQETLTVEPVGTVHVYQGVPSPTRVFVLVSGAEGWKGEIVEWAKELSQKDALVLGVDYNGFEDSVKGEHFICPCGDFERVSLYAQRQKGFKKYLQPVLIGKDDGSELVYAAMAESPNTFLGGIGIGFCPRYGDIRRMCKGYGLTYNKGRGGEEDSFEPYTEMKDPFAVFPSSTCGPKEAREFIHGIPRGQLLEARPKTIADMLPLVSEWQTGYDKVQANVLDLPLIEYPSSSGDTLVVILSGDGGWISLDRDIAEYLSDRHIAVVGFDMLRYLWPAPSADQGGKDLDKLLSYYLTQWKKKQALLIGFSMGADALAFMTPRLQANAAKVAGVALLGPSVKSEFGLDITNQEKEGPSGGDPLLPYIRKISSKVLCIGGSVEHDSLCRRTENAEEVPSNMSIELLHGGHMLKDDFEDICNAITKNLGVSLAAPENH